MVQNIFFRKPLGRRVYPTLISLLLYDTFLYRPILSYMYMYVYVDRIINISPAISRRNHLKMNVYCTCKVEGLFIRVLGESIISSAGFWGQIPPNFGIRPVSFTKNEHTKLWTSWYLGGLHISNMYVSFLIHRRVKFYSSFQYICTQTKPQEITRLRIPAVNKSGRLWSSAEPYIHPMLRNVRGSPIQTRSLIPKPPLIGSRWEKRPKEEGKASEGRRHNPEP